MRIRPCIDLHDGKVKQIVGSSLRDSSERELHQNYVSDRDAGYYAGIYRQKGLTGGHVILLNARQTDRGMYEADLAQAFAAFRAFPGGLQAGGGITPENAGRFLEAGASHVIVTSYCFRDGRLEEDRLREMVRTVGREHLVLDLSCRKLSDGTYRVVTDRWQKLTSLPVNADTLWGLCGSCAEFLIHAADVEGKRGGVEQDLVRMIGGWQIGSGFPVTYAGGVHSLQDIEDIRRLSDDRMDVTVGSALDLFGGSLTLDSLMRAASQPEGSQTPETQIQKA